MDILQIRGIILVFCSVFNLILALILWFRGRSKATFHLGWVAFFSAVYAFTYGGVWLFENKLFWSRATWLGVLVLSAYITFIYYFTETTKHLKLKSFFWYFGAIIISYLALTTPYFIEKVYPEHPCPFLEGGGPLEPLGRVYVITCLGISLFYLLKEYFKSQGFRKLQLKYFILGIAIYSGGGVLFAGILPLFSPEFIKYLDLSVLLSVFWVGFTFYAVFKKRLFEIRVILTELLVGALGIILVILPFLMPTTFLKILTVFIFLLFCLFGYFLIKAIYQELKAEEILEEKVKERTKELEKSKEEIQKAYEEIKRRKEELEKVLKAVVGRELRMIELKKRIKELEEKLKKE